MQYCSGEYVVCLSCIAEGGIGICNGQMYALYISMIDLYEDEWSLILNDQRGSSGATQQNHNIVEKLNNIFHALHANIWIHLKLRAHLCLCVSICPIASTNEAQRN